MAKTWVIAILLAIVSAFAQDFTVTIGKDASAPAFDPPSLSNYTDDSSVEFVIYGTVHIVESTFEQPCVPKADGSTFATSASPTQYNIQITTFEGNGQPLWFSDTSRCAAGMVFAINPTTQQTYDQFKANAMKGGVTSTSSSKELSATSLSQTPSSKTPSSTVTPKSSSGSALDTNLLTGVILLMQLLICLGH